MNGSDFQGADVRALQADEFANPMALWVARGESLWGEARSGRSCAACHGKAAASMKGVAARYPRWDAATGRVVNLEERINACVVGQQGAPRLAAESDELLALEAYVARQSRGMPLEVSIDGPAHATWEAGRALYFTRMGQLNLACTQCHDAELGPQAARRDGEPGPSHRLARLSPRMAARGLARAAPARLLQRRARRDAALRLPRPRRPRALPRLARPRPPPRIPRRPPLTNQSGSESFIIHGVELRRRIVTWIALVAVGWVTLWPAVAEMHASMAGEAVPLCHQAGSMVMPDMPDMKGMPAAPQDDRGRTHCPLCIMAFFAALPPALHVPQADYYTHAVARDSHCAPMPYGLEVRIPPGRAPPASSIA